MQFIWWLTGVIAMVTACRFIILVFKKLTSKENMEAIIDSATDGIARGASNVANRIKSKKREKKEASQCRVTIH